MDSLLNLMAGWAFWRLALAVGLSAVLAAALAWADLGGVGAPAVALLVGVVAGIGWQARGEHPARHASLANEAPRLSWPIAALGWAFLGALWGAWLWVMPSASGRGLALLVLAALPALGWMRQRPRRRRLATLLGAYGCLTLGMVAGFFWAGRAT